MNDTIESPDGPRLVWVDEATGHSYGGDEIARDRNHFERLVYADREGDVDIHDESTGRRVGLIASHAIGSRPQWYVGVSPSRLNEHRQMIAAIRQEAMAEAGRAIRAEIYALPYTPHNVEQAIPAMQQAIAAIEKRAAHARADA